MHHIFRSFVVIFSILTLSQNVKAYSEINKAAIEPEQIVSITQKIFEMDYYHTQVQLWKDKLEEKQDDANAWMNYYLASRIVNILTENQTPHDLQKIYEGLREHAKGSYEYHYLTYLHGWRDTSLFPHLAKAYELDSDRTEVLSHMIAYYAIKADEDKMAFYSERWLKSGEISTGILNWNYNALIGLEEDAILLTNGDNDTYPAWMLQQVEGVRTDVKVINFNLLRDKEYFKNTLAACGIKTPFTSNSGSIEGHIDLMQIVDHIFQYASRPVYVNVTVPKRIRENYKDALYTVGLAFKYSEHSFNNMEILKDNVENKFLTDYLKVSFSNDKSVSVLNSMNVNYLPAFISLYKHYLKGNEKYKAKNIREVIESISAASGRSEEIRELLDKPKNKHRKIDTHIDIKALDKMMKPITPTLWASNTETTNTFYEKFLLDLLEEKEFELLEKCKSDKVDWKSYLHPDQKNLPELELFKNANPDDDLVPAVNMTYEAAVTYCEWLTIAYNSYSKKKKYKKVLFRLPTEEEWEYAARAGHAQTSYPWNGYYAVNSKGCYLSNFDCANEPPRKECDIQTPAKDGAYFPVLASSYYPNDYDLYGMSGNAAEMVQGGKIAKGGSWQDIPDDCRITSKKEVSGPSPAIGFRVFMEVVAH